MKKDMEIKIGRDIYERISVARMSESERQVALNAMRDAEVLVNAIVWLTRKIEQVAAYLFRSSPKPSLKH
ncbi:MAG: hypothetical protein A3G24_00770 [Betaproteobacteria bacterium RIFCSPLOWO2_12_FULL_62_13]|nr:MAG: hypothetical protein A3G24_00770 [Betaproteobacteria bacterium RIFCSPLOWO2_12_FULL_62_13]